MENIKHYVVDKLQLTFRVLDEKYDTRLIKAFKDARMFTKDSDGKTIKGNLKWEWFTSKKDAVKFIEETKASNKKKAEEAAKEAAKTPKSTDVDVEAIKAEVQTAMKADLDAKDEENKELKDAMKVLAEQVEALTKASKK